MFFVCLKSYSDIFILKIVFRTYFFFHLFSLEIILLNMNKNNYQNAVLYRVLWQILYSFVSFLV